MILMLVSPVCFERGCRPLLENRSCCLHMHEMNTRQRVCRSCTRPPLSPLFPLFPLSLSDQLSQLAVVPDTCIRSACLGCSLHNHALSACLPWRKKLQRVCLFSLCLLLSPWTVHNALLPTERQRRLVLLRLGVRTHTSVEAQ